MTAPDKYGQGVAVWQMTDPPSIPDAAQALADGIIPRNRHIPDNSDDVMGIETLQNAAPGDYVGSLITFAIIKLPPGDGAPLVAGLQVTATVIDDGAAAPARAFVLRETTTGNVLFAADMAQQGEKLLTAADIAPFTVGTGTVALGCTQDVCGRFVQFAAEFSNGTDSVEISPGHIEALGSGSAKWSFLNVGNGKYDASASTCEVTELRPYVFWKSSIP